MSKQSGLGDYLYIGGYDASGDIGSVNRIGGGPTALDVTAINKAAMERIGGLRDGGIDYTAFFNPALGGTHAKLAALPTTDVLMTYVRGATLGGPVANCIAKQLNHDGTRGDDGAFTFAGSTQSSAGSGLEWCEGLTAGRRTDTTATNGATVDLLTGPTAFGLQAYLHVFALTGTSVTVTIEHSADGLSWSALTGAAFTAVTAAPASQRIQTSRTQTVQRYVRAITTGTFTNAQFAVSAARNSVGTTF
ncbi:hypothetical protein C5F59_027455 [Streptomyces sp. QL37]|uniref:hypothetical protein n=1 Tax=Streptomyces sp. QL37 TaxID=2093747 RepID=UPI000CF25F6B|nr:hypothetical protein [Streptomyces sp. QL37]PPQ57148.1 hypothetical protein C5F59_10975 [Streptomyces sp. QL37]